jgi:hypothetical protein
MCPALWLQMDVIFFHIAPHTLRIQRGRDGLLALKNDKVKMFIAEEF